MSPGSNTLVWYIFYLTPPLSATTSLQARSPGIRLVGLFLGAACGGRASQRTFAVAVAAVLVHDVGPVLDRSVARPVLSGADGLVVEDLEEVVEARGEERA